jgi:CubicO group peptidase (beta-lactamase class C family)
VRKGVEGVNNNRFASGMMVVILFLTSCGQASNPALPYARELQEVLDAARESAGLVGVSAAIIVPGYEPWLGVSGESHPGQPITPDMLFDIGSAGKIILGPLMVKLAEDGLISLDDPMRTYLPDFPYAGGSITIRQLLNHTRTVPEYGNRGNNTHWHLLSSKIRHMYYWKTPHFASVQWKISL